MVNARTVTAIVLAAGLSRRTAPQHKLLAPDATGRPMVAHCLTALGASRVASRIIVAGYTADALTPWLADGDIIARNPAPERGLASSLRIGVERALSGTRPDGLLICLADMPLITPALIDRVINAWSPGDCDVCTPMCGERPGHPVLWSATMFDALSTLNGDTGARALLRAPGLRHRTVAAGPECLTDFDTPDDLATFAGLG